MWLVIHQPQVCLFDRPSSLSYTFETTSLVSQSLCSYPPRLVRLHTSPIASMSGSNPFAFTGFNVPQLPSSEASLRADLAKSRHTVAMLQREVREANDANGVAQALVAAKTQVQEAQRESKRAQMCEKIAREALATLNNAQKRQTEEHNMSEDWTLYEEQVRDLKKKLAEEERESGGLREELETCKGNLDNAHEQLKVSITFQKHDAILREHHTEYQTAHEDAEKARAANTALQNNLQTVQGRLTAIEEKLKESTRIADAFRAENVQHDNALKEQKEVNRHLEELNNNLLADVNDTNTKRGALVHERDELQLKFTEAFWSLQMSQHSELQAREKLEQYEVNAERLAREHSTQNEELQIESKTLHERVKGHANEIAAKDARIALFEQENEFLLTMFKGHQAQDSVNTSADRPSTHRTFSAGSTLAEEGFQSDDEDLSDHSSDNEDSVKVSIVHKHSEVHEIFSVAPHAPHAPSPTLCIVNAASTTPQQCHDSLSLDLSPVTNVSSIGSAQSVMPALPIYTGEAAQVSPQMPVAPTLELSEPATQAVSPRNPIAAPLTISSVSRALEYPPAEPTISTHNPPTEDELSSPLVNVLVDYPLVEPSISTPNVATATQNLSLNVLHHASIAVRPSPIVGLRLRPLDPHPMPAHGFIENELALPWPVADEDDDEPPSAASTIPPTPLVGPAVALNKGLSLPNLHILAILVAILSVYCYYLYQQLRAWELANGDGFIGGSGSHNDRYTPYGNGHLLLAYFQRMVPGKWVSADSPFPSKAVDMMTGVASAFEGLVGLAPTPYF